MVHAAAMPCGHCGWCQGERVGDLPAAPARPLGEVEDKLLQSLRAKRHEALASPRQLARYLCGLTSPATTKAKLTKEPA